MKALTIRQPWAWAILEAGKDIENRDWPTSFRGRVAVHSSKRVDPTEYVIAKYATREKGIEVNWPDRSNLIGGAILGTIEIIDCVTQSDSRWFFGEYGFVLRNPIILPEPIPCKGALGFWAVPADIESRIYQQLLTEAA